MACFRSRGTGRHRLVILEDVEGNTVIIDIGSSPAEFDEFMPEAQKVVDSVK